MTDYTLKYLQVRLFGVFTRKETDFLIIQHPHSKEYKTIFNMRKGNRSVSNHDALLYI